MKISETEYDGGGVGDGNVTRTTSIPGSGAANRVSSTYYDWRNRAVASKSGVETSEGTSVNRPISYTEYDHLGQAIAQETYDGDGVTIADSNSDGVPDKPSSSLRRSRSESSYDEQGRAYQTRTYSGLKKSRVPFLWRSLEKEMYVYQIRKSKVWSSMSVLEQQLAIANVVERGGTIVGWDKWLFGVGIR